MDKINQKFRENELIQKMANDALWTFSTPEKIPVDINYLISNAKIKWASFKDNNPLTTLHRIDSVPELTTLNRTYYLNACKNKIFIIDIEKTASEETKNFFKQIPVNYGEVSMSGKGIHLMIQLEEDEIPPEAEYIINEITVLKTKKGDVEFLFNNHFCTLTKNQIPIIQKDKNNPIHKQIIKDLLLNLVAFDKENKKIREQKKEIFSSYQNKKHDDICGTIKVVLEQHEFSKTLDDYNNDHSRYEAAYATFLITKILELIDYMKHSQKKVVKKKIENLDDDDIIYIAYRLLKDKLEYREKHDEKRKGLPWLLSVANRAYYYIKSSKTRSNNEST